MACSSEGSNFLDFANFHVKLHRITVLSPIKAPSLKEAPPNFEGLFFLYFMFVTVAPGYLNLI